MSHRKNNLNKHFNSPGYESARLYI